MEIDADLRRKTAVSAVAVGLFLVTFTAIGVAFPADIPNCGNASSMESLNDTNASSMESLNDTNASSTGTTDCGIALSNTGGFAIVGALAGFVLLMAGIGTWLNRTETDDADLTE